VQRALQDRSEDQIDDLIREYEGREENPMGKPRKRNAKTRTRKRNEEAPPASGCSMTFPAWLLASGLPLESGFGAAGEPYLAAWRRGELPGGLVEVIDPEPGPPASLTIIEADRVRVGNPTPPSYKGTHWGIASTKSTTLDVPDPRANRAKGLIQLGVLVSIVYLTEKGGDGELVEYEHKFDATHPRLAYGSKDGKLYIAGGSYRVESRGIVG
jgi:hypothetical protein